MTAEDKKQLDVITIGRASVDLYGQQIGSRLEDIASFAKSVGGCPANIAVGTARLGLRSALLTRVGDEQMGRFIREQLLREGVSDRGDFDRRQAADGAGAAGRRGRGRLADDLLPGRLRRHGALGGGCRRGLHRLGAGNRRHRHAFFPRPQRPRAAQGHPHRQAGGGGWSSTSTTGPTSGGSPGTPRDSSATSSRRRFPKSCGPCCLTATCRRHRGGDHDRLGRRRRARRAEDHPVAVLRNRSS